MFRSMSRPRPRVKPHRKSARLAAPFGRGLIRFTPEFEHRDHDAIDELWLAKQSDPEPSDAEYDRIAAERGWEDAYEISMASGERCRACGLADDFLTADSLCPPCDLARLLADFPKRKTEADFARDKAEVAAWVAERAAERAGDDFAVVWDGLA